MKYVKSVINNQDSANGRSFSNIIASIVPTFSLCCAFRHSILDIIPGGEEDYFFFFLLQRPRKKERSKSSGFWTDICNQQERKNTIWVLDNAGNLYSHHQNLLCNITMTPTQHLLRTDVNLNVHGEIMESELLQISCGSSFSKNSEVRELLPHTHCTLFTRNHKVNIASHYLRHVVLFLVDIQIPDFGLLIKKSAAPIEDLS